MKVTIRVKENTQANLIAILAENGALSEFLNEEIKKRNLGDFVQQFDESPLVEFDADTDYPEHEVTF